MRTHVGLLTAVIAAIGGITHAQPTTRPATSPVEQEPIGTNTANVTHSQATTEPATQSASAPGELGKVVVTADLDVQREQIAPSLGASTYTLTPDRIQNMPAGQNAPFDQVLLRAPGVVQDSFGQIHVRGEHANLTYRVNGVLLPQPVSEFGQELDTRLVDSLTLITGSLPAQYGFHTAGVVDVQTKSGDTLNHNELSLYGGSYDTFNPSLQLGGTSGKLDYFVTASHLHSNIGIENPTASHRPIHDYTNQERFFGYLSYRLDDTSRLSVLTNASYANFEVPNTPDIDPSFTLAGVPTFDSSNLNETQNEQEYYTVVSYQKTADKLSLQLSGFSRYGLIDFSPDSTGDLIFNGVASGVYNSFLTNGVQFDASYIANDHHTIRGGFIANYTEEQQNSSTGVFPLTPAGDQGSDTPFYISDHSNNYAWEAGVYLQDEWRLTDKLTLNYGARFDGFISNFDTESQLSPRVNVVWKATKATTFHAGYARYFVPPSIQNVDNTTIDKFAGTTNTPENFLADASKVERSHYFDLGVLQQITPTWNVGVDGFYKQAKNLVDLGQFGQALLLSPFNYKSAKVYGAELTTDYSFGGFSTYGNLSWVETAAHDIDSQQFLIGNDELAFISDHDIHLDHDSQFAASAGVAYQWKNDRVYADILYGSGLRTGFANTGQVAPHYPVNVGWEHIFRLKSTDKNALRFRVDVVNIFDQRYEIRDGGGIGVGAPQFGERLGIFAGITYEF